MVDSLAHVPGGHLLNGRGLLYGLVALVAGGILAFATLQPVKVMPRVRLAPGFLLVDQDGQRLTSEDLRGQIVLYSFLYTRCHSPDCDYIIETLRTVQDRLAEMDLGDTPVTLITISFDPERDTPDVLRAYAQSVGADPQRWRFATGDPKRLKYIIGGGFEVYYKANEDGTFTFDPTFILVDGWGIIRAEYRYQTLVPDTERILRHIGVVLKEVRNSKGAARFAYEAAHLFLCYAH